MQSSRTRTRILFAVEGTSVFGMSKEDSVAESTNPRTLDSAIGNETQVMGSAWLEASSVAMAFAIISKKKYYNQNQILIVYVMDFCELYAQTILCGS